MYTYLYNVYEENIHIYICDNKEYNYERNRVTKNMWYPMCKQNKGNQTHNSDAISFLNCALDSPCFLHMVSGNYFLENRNKRTCHP